MKLASTAAIVAALLLLGACGGGEEDGADQPEGSWRVTEVLHDGGVSTLLAGTEITAEFATDGSLSGSGGCNSYGGDYEIDDSEIQILELVATRMACLTPKGLMEQEQAYFDALREATRFRLEGGGLSLLSARGTVTVSFESAR